VPRTCHGLPPPGSAEKDPPASAGWRVDASKPARVTVNRETERLVEELKRQYSLPVYINDGAQVYVDDMTDRAGTTSTSRDIRPQCTHVFPVLLQSKEVSK